MSSQAKGKLPWGDDRGTNTHVDSSTESGGAPRRTTGTKAEAPSRSAGTEGGAPENPQRDNKEQKKDGGLAPGQSPTPPGEVPPGHNPEKEADGRS